MANYRSLLLGCGPRATEHADVYKDLPNMEWVGACDLIEERRERFKTTYDIPETFDDFETALAQTQPDIVHVCTSPGRRIWEAERAAAAGVKACIFEKPVAVKPSDLEGLERVLADTDMKIVVNCQRRYFPQFRDGVIADIIREKLGDVYFIRASTKGNTMGMGPHTMSLLKLFLDEAEPEAVWAAAHTINETSYQITHEAPESLLAEYWFPGGLRVMFDCDPEALGTPGEELFWMHLHFDVLGTEGRLYLTQNAGDWYQENGAAEPIHGPSSWDDQGRQGQRDFTQAVADWLDGGPPHLNRLEVEGPVVHALFGAQKSVYEGNRVELPTKFTDEEWTELRGRLKAIDHVTE